MSVVEDGLRSTPNFVAQARRITAYARGQLTNEAAELLLARTHAALEDAYRDGRLSMPTSKVECGRISESVD